MTRKTTSRHRNQRKTQKRTKPCNQRGGVMCSDASTFEYQGKKYCSMTIRDAQSVYEKLSDSEKQTKYHAIEIKIVKIGTITGKNMYLHDLKQNRTTTRVQLSQNYGEILNPVFTNENPTSPRSKNNSPLRSRSPSRRNSPPKSVKKPRSAMKGTQPKPNPKVGHGSRSIMFISPRKSSNYGEDSKTQIMMEYNLADIHIDDETNSVIKTKFVGEDKFSDETQGELVTQPTLTMESKERQIKDFIKYNTPHFFTVFKAKDDNVYLCEYNPEHPEENQIHCRNIRGDKKNDSLVSEDAVYIPPTDIESIYDEPGRSVRP